MTTIRNIVLTALCVVAQLTLCLASSEGVGSLIFPTPREITESGSDFALDNRVTIAIPSAASQENLDLARFLMRELGDRFALHPE